MNKQPVQKNRSTIQSIEPHKLHHCKMCKAPIWLPADREVHVLGMACSEKCEELYQELRYDGHYN